MNRELPDVQAGFRKGRGTSDQIANIHWIMKKAREFQPTIGNTKNSAAILTPRRMNLFFSSWSIMVFPPHSFHCFTCFLTCIQVSQEAGQVVWYSHLFENFPQFVVIHTVKGFGIVNKAEIDVFLELSCFFDHLADVGNLISGSSAFSKTSLNIWKFTVHVLLEAWLGEF